MFLVFEWYFAQIFLAGQQVILCFWVDSYILEESVIVSFSSDMVITYVTTLV
jgi:hypothetical protein